MKIFQLKHRIGPAFQVGKKDYLFFSGTSYLGMDQDPHYEAVLFDCIRQYGFNHGLSRVNNLRLKVFDEFEVFFAKKAKAEAAAVMSSGYLAGITAWQWLYPQSDLCWIAPDTHPAILPLDLKPDYQLNFTKWKNHCLNQADALSSRKILILGNAVDPLKAEIHSYEWVKEIAKKHEVTLLIDDSHAFGVLGKGVFGTYSQWIDPQINLVVSGSLGKGLAMPAGIILGKKEVIEGMKSQTVFTGASPGSPANLQAFMETQDMYQAQSKKIRDFSSIFSQETQSFSSVTGSGQFPVFILNDDSLPDRLEQSGIIVSSFPYPKPESPKISRIVLSGFHTLGDLMVLIESLYQLSEK
ncbi:aminotransferase class I/II-fold pyridoxal phosphate-dependent enzyme [Algoriphagus taiwanensis]|uniref:Glycine C-acetyltransferase n=1 Tax=Algoriphagus taiwanensis TaxID=1445656 RepID=A0ABQ6Q1V5_9BACT|nr:glycine C-acetyltransferase [Algoriphagus taiwanensis]